MVPLFSSCSTAPSRPPTYWKAPSIASSHRAFPFTLSFHLVQTQLLAEAGLTGAMASDRAVQRSSYKHLLPGLFMWPETLFHWPYRISPRCPPPHPTGPLAPISPSLLCSQCQPDQLQHFPLKKQYPNISNINTSFTLITSHDIFLTSILARVEFITLKNKICTSLGIY